MENSLDFNADLDNAVEKAHFALFFNQVKNSHYWSSVQIWAKLSSKNSIDCNADLDTDTEMAHLALFFNQVKNSYN